MEKQEKSSYQKIEFVNIMQLFLLGYYNLYVLDMVICQRHSHYPFLMIIAVCFSFWAREKVDKFWVYFFTRLAVILYGCIIGRDVREKVIFALAGAVISMVSWYRRIHINHKVYIENIGVLWLILLFPGYAFMGIYGKEDTSDILLGIGVLFIWLYYLNKYQSNREQFFMNNKKTVGIMQDKAIKSNSNKGMLFFLVCSFITLFLESGLYLDGLENKVRNTIFRFFKWILEILTNVEEEESLLQEAVEMPLPENQGDGYGELFQGSEWLRQFFKMLEHILWGVVEVLWVVCIIFVLFSTVYGIWYIFYHKGKRGESRVLHQEDVKIQKVKKEPRKEQQRRGLHIFRNPNQKIRQLFYTEIKEHQKGNNNKECMTAMELTNQVYDERKEVARYLLPYYQRARYSNKGITKEEANKCSRYRKDAKRTLG